MLTVTTTDGQTSTAQVTPDYRDIKRTWQRQNGHIYHNESLNGTVKFKDTDFDLIHGQSLYARFALAVYDKGVRVGRCEFRKTDCRFDVDHKLIELQLRVSDRYKKIEDNADKEINLVKQGLGKKSLSLSLYPIKQFYVNGSSDICQFKQQYVGSPSVAGQTSHAILEKMYFSVTTRGADISKMLGATVGGVVRIETSPTPLMGVVAGDYYNNTAVGYENYSIVGNYGSVYKKLWKDGNVGVGDFVKVTLFMALVGGSYYYRVDYHRAGATGDGQPWAVILSSSATDIPVETPWSSRVYCNDADTFVSRTAALIYRVTPATGYIDVNNRQGVTVKFWEGYTRVCFADSTGSPLLNEGLDIADIYRGNYLTALPFSTPTKACVSNRVDDNNNPLPPDDNDVWSPIDRNSWHNSMSFWLRKDDGLPTRYMESHRATKIIQDFYTFGDAIKAVINDIDSSVIFESDTDHSKFLFSNVNPLTQEQQKPMYVTQKSNILNVGYDYPAWLAPIKWQQIETLLRNAFNCYWDIYIDAVGNKHLRIEHLAFYENGMSYDGTTPATLDLHGIYNSANEIPYSFRTDRWEWDKANAASTYEYGWMDNQSEIFNGHDIIIPEEYRLFSDDSKEERRVDWFSSDIDFLVVVPSECSSDGFAIVMEDLSRDGWVMQDFNNIYGGQNWRLSLTYMQPRYCIAGLYSPIVEIDGERISNGILARMRTAEVKFKIPEGRTITPLTVLFTDAGTGTIEKLEKDLNSDTFTATLTYPNE